MTDAEKLQQVIQKAIDNEWNLFGYAKTKNFKWKVDDHFDGFLFLIVFDENGDCARSYVLEQIFFDHDFCKAFFGEDRVCEDCFFADLEKQEKSEYCKAGSHIRSYIIPYLYHIAKLAQSTDRIEYLFNFDGDLEDFKNIY